MTEPQELVHLASLLASRLCHDLVNPAGALRTGLEVLAEEDSDQELRDHALRLISESADKTIAMLQFARMAYGSSGTLEGELDVAEAGRLAAGIYDHAKADLAWDMTSPSMAKLKLRAVLNLVLIAEKAAPRAGSVVTVWEEGDAARVEMKGPKIKLGEEMEAALAGRPVELASKETPAYLAHLLARSGGYDVGVEREGDDRCVLTVAPR
jgi:histidine phosphotransferase ChpT